QPCHVKAETGIERIGEYGEPLYEQRADVVRITQRPRGAGGDAAYHAVGAEQGQFDAAGAIAAPLPCELQLPRQACGDRQDVLLARNRFGKALLGDIRGNRQPWRQRLVFVAECTIKLAQHLGPKTCGEWGAWLIRDVADALQANPSEAYDRHRRKPESGQWAWGQPRQLPARGIPFPV